VILGDRSTQSVDEDWVRHLGTESDLAALSLHGIEHQQEAAQTKPNRDRWPFVVGLDKLFGVADAEG
jgi:hypothetical protein